MQKSILYGMVGLILVACVDGLLSSRTSDQAAAQVGGKAASPAKINTLKTLDTRAEQLQSSFVKDANDLARQYENLGEYDKAKQILQAVQRVNPQAPGIKERIDSLNETMLSQNQYEVEVDTGVANWGLPRGRVFGRQKFRVQASGSYRFTAQATIGAAGFPTTTDPSKADLVPGVQCGALMGLFVVNGKPGTPFEIGEEQEITPRDDGLLFLRVNAPATAKCQGKLIVRLGGAVQKL